MENEMGGACRTHGKIEKMYILTILVGKTQGKRHLGDLGVDGRIILKLILEK
jgi:hypothetical protein